ncbi:MAG: VirE protein [Bacteroidaceae bacterium]|nr:VirE protein [Bacteroidaceae bacterium]
MSFGIARSIRGEVRACTPDLFNEALDSPIVARVCAEIEDNLEAYRSGKLSKEEHDELKAKLKKRLPIFTFHATFPGGRRKNDDAVPSGLSIYDLDHIANPRAKWDEIEARKEELGIVLAHVSPSTEGLRLVFVIPQGMTLPEAQAWMAQRLGDKEYDTSVKDYARCSFAVPRGYVLWMSEELFTDPEPPLNPPSMGDLKKAELSKLPSIEGGEVNTFNNEEENSKLVRASSHQATQVKVQGSREEEENKSVKSVKSVPKNIEYHGLPASEIVQKYWELNNDGQPPTQGDRNTKIFDLACSLRHIFGFDRELLNRAIPNYEGFPQEEKMQCIDNAIREPRKYMPMKLTKVLQALKTEKSNLPPSGETEGGFPPQMPTKLPPLIELLTRNVPEAMKPAVAHAVFPPLGTHLGGVKFRYIDNVEREATFMCVLLAKMSSGKSAVNKPIELIMKDIVERDALNRLREQEWKASLSTKGANKEKPKRPEGLCIQMLVPDMTNAAFVQRLADAQGKFLYTQMDELELLNNLKTSARGNQVSQIIRLAFEQGLYGQERVGAASVTAMVPIRWNWNASATIERGRQFFRTALTDGTLSRLNFCTIPPRRMGEIPVYGTYNAEYEAELKPYIDRLNAASGLVECAKAEALAHTLLKESAEVVMLTDDEVYEMLSHRANVIAYLKAMTLYIAHGYKWSKQIEEFVRWSKEYDLWCKMHFYGKRMQEEVEKEIIRTTPGRTNMLEMLPDKFTRTQLEEVRVRLGKERDAAHQLSKWKKRGYVVVDQVDTDLYIKSEKYKRRIDN